MSGKAGARDVLDLAVISDGALVIIAVVTVGAIGIVVVAVGAIVIVELFPIGALTVRILFLPGRTLAVFLVFVSDALVFIERIFPLNTIVVVIAPNAVADAKRGTALWCAPLVGRGCWCLTSRRFSMSVLFSGQHTDPIATRQCASNSTQPGSSSRRV